VRRGRTSKKKRLLPEKERMLSLQDEEEAKLCGWQSLPIEIGSLILNHLATQD